MLEMVEIWTPAEYVRVREGGLVIDIYEKGQPPRTAFLPNEYIIKDNSNNNGIRILTVARRIVRRFGLNSLIRGNKK